MNNKRLIIFVISSMVFLYGCDNTKPSPTPTPIPPTPILATPTMTLEPTPEDEYGQLGRTLNTLTAQLEETIRNQEQIIAERTRALETSTEVSRRLSTIL